MEAGDKKNSRQRAFIVVMAMVTVILSVLAYRAYEYQQRVEEQTAAEREFLADLAAHEQEAVALAQVGEERAEAQEAKELARSIQEVRRERLKQIGKWQDRWYGGGPKAPEGGSFRGIASTGHQQAKARLLTAEDFDRVFLTVMIPHTEQGVYMDSRAAERVRHLEVKDLALQVTAKEQQELELMQAYARSGFPSTYTSEPQI